MILLNAPLVGQRLGYADLSGLDLLELFAFLHPARFMVPTPKGLANAAGLPEAEDDAGIARLLLAAAERLLAVPAGDWPEREGAWTAVQSLFRLRWPWAPLLTERIRKPEKPERWLFSRLAEWEETAPRPAPRTIQLHPQQATERLATLTGIGAETRPGQRAYAEAAALAFAPRAVRESPNLVLAEAGTGIGKTLGYLAPSSLWAEAAGGPVWVSTFTKALQRQLSNETRRLYPDDAVRRARVVTRKGRENYLCLLNLEDALQGGFAGRAAILAQLVARWAAYSADGDMVGGDLPGWLTTLFRRNGQTALTDRRGECVYAGCPHYRKCVIERAARASAEADIVIANHALVMVNAARGRELSTRPTRYVFDEGHHLFDAADAMFGVALTGGETIELRRWILGPEAGGRGRRRGLAARLSDVASYDEAGGRAIADAVVAAQALAGEGWNQRLAEGQPFGPVESLLAAVRGLVYARAEQPGDAGYGLETELAEPSPELIEAAAACAHALDALVRPLVTLGKRLEAVLADAPDWMDTQARARIEGAIASLGWRAETVAAWLALLARVGGPANADFVDWLAVDRFEGREFDIGLHRRWLDPTRPFAEIVLKPAHGALVTSATLTAGADWETAEARVGAPHLARAATRFEAPSPFDYPANAEVLIVTDIKRGDVPQLAGAYARLIEAAGGGTLGLFTAIRRLRGVHAADRQPARARGAAAPRPARRSDRHGHVGRHLPRRSARVAARHRCAARRGERARPFAAAGGDGGRAWPKPSVLHAARRLAGGGSAYDDRIVRARLAQAFGRLIRRADDHGAFVLLSAAMPSRLLSAFPPGVPIARVPLDEAVARVALRVSGRLSSGQAIGHGARVPA